MIKLVNMLVRADDLTHEEFVEYWYDEHVPLAKDLPHATTYATSVPTDPERSEYDGVVELYFEDMGDLQAAFESEVGRAVQADLAEFAKPEEGPTLYVEETVQFERDAHATVDASDAADDASNDVADANESSGAEE